jgi:amicyanin
MIGDRMVRRSPNWIAILLLSAISSSAILGADSPKKAVSIKDMKFQPATLEIKVGETVVWTNNDDRDHTVVGPKDTFKSDNLRPGSAYSYQFTKAGTFDYTCTYHPRMKGTIKVSAK